MTLRASLAPALYAVDEVHSRVLMVREAGTPAPSRPRLRDRVRHAIRARHYHRRTEKAYVHWVKRCILFHGKRHPADMGAPEVTGFPSSLATDGQVAASTENQALSALLFLYRDVLTVDLPWLDGVVRAKRPEPLPVVLTREEVRRIISRLDGPPPRLGAMLLDGAGLRLLECARFRVKDVDFARNHLMVRAGKGNKDRVTMLPDVVKVSLARHLELVKEQHERDLAPHRPGVVGPPRREHDDDLHARAQPGPGRCPEPRRPDIRAVIHSESPGYPRSAYPARARRIGMVTTSDSKGRAVSATKRPALHCPLPQRSPGYTVPPNTRWTA